MKQYNGKSVFGGIAIGTLQIYKKDVQQVKRTHIENVSQEVMRYETAKAEAIRQLGVLYDKALKEVGETNAAIFETHQMMLQDEDYSDSVKNIINTQHVNAEYAVGVTSDNYSNMFAVMEDDYMRERAMDVKDVSERVISILKGTDTENLQSKAPVILVAEDLAPSETVQLDKENILAFVTRRGSVNSHTAILARTMGIPALIGTDISLEADFNGRQAVVDGNKGCLYVEPEEEFLEKMKKQRQEELEKKELLKQLKGKESITLDGKKIKLYANIGNIKDLALVLEHDAEGIGLFRSEFLYLEKENYPTEEEQFQVYKTVAETMAGKQVIIRTLDIGADKQCPYFQIEKEENPALGYRAIRICLTEPDVFKTQLRAIFRAGIYGSISVMYPMITSMKEMKQIQKIVEEVKSELEQQKMQYVIPKQGIMIETPAAVMISRELAEEVDFFSIGTNDLTQYTLAVDRQNPKLDSFYDAHHPAILRMIETVIKNAHEAGIWAGICGELAADLEVIPVFLKMGVDELSMSPSHVLQVRKVIIENRCVDSIDLC